LAGEALCSPLTFRAEIEGEVSPNAGYLKWYIDGVEELAARDRMVWSKELAGGTYSIGMEVLSADNILKTIESDISVYSALELNPLHDTTICWLDSLSLNMTTHYQWQDTSANAIYTVWQNDNEYWVSVYDGCKQRGDTLNISYLDNLKVDLGEDTLFCFRKNVLTLDATSPFASYRWQDGSTLPVCFVRQSGIYRVTVSNACRSVTDEIQVNVIDCADAYIPNAFTPDGDGINDLFYPVFDNPEEVLYYDFRIFNRWGQQLFHSVTVGEGWDGGSFTMNVFSWILEYELKGEGLSRRKRGSVTLAR
jgi:gliding motility-associated-like protein